MIPASEAAGLLGSQPCVQRATTRLFAHFQRKQGAYARIVSSRHWQINMLDVGLMKCRDVRDARDRWLSPGSYPKIRGYAYPKYRAKGFYIGHWHRVAVAVALSSLRCTAHHRRLKPIPHLRLTRKNELNRRDCNIVSSYVGPLWVTPCIYTLAPSRFRFRATPEKNLRRIENRKRKQHQ